MTSSQPSWDVQDQNDRIISILAWVVVVVLVIYASAYVYKQAHVSAARSAATVDLAASSSLAREGTVALPGRRVRPVALAPLSTDGAPVASSAPVDSLPGGAERGATGVTRSQPPPARQGIWVTNPSRPGMTPPTRLASTEPASPAPVPRLAASAKPVKSSAAGGPWAVEVGGAHATPREAHDLLFALPTMADDVDFVQSEDGWHLRIGKFRTRDEAVALEAKLKQGGTPTSVVIASSPPVRTKTLRPLGQAQTAGPGAAETGAAQRRRVKLQAAAEAAARSSDESEEEDESSTPGTAASAAAVAPATTRPAPRATRAVTTAAAVDEEEEADPAPARPTPTPARVRRSVPAVEEGAPQSPAVTNAEGDTDIAQAIRSAGGQSAPNGTADEETEEAETHYAVQIAAYGSVDKAKTVAGNLRRKGMTAKIDQTVRGDRTLYRVRVGSFETAKAAQSAARKLAGELGAGQLQVVRF